MRAIQILMSIAAILALTSSAATGENFGDFLENLDVEKLMNDEASWKTVYECIMDKAPCGDYKELRATFLQVVETKCAQCTPKQKEKLGEISKLVALKYPKDFQDISGKYKLGSLPGE